MYLSGEVYVASKTFEMEPVSKVGYEAVGLGAASDTTSVLACGGMDRSGWLVKTNSMLVDSLQAQPCRPLPHRRFRHAVAGISTGKFLVVGGVMQDENKTLAMATDVLLFDTTRDQWEEVAQLPLPSAQLVAECIGDKVFVIAGDTGTNTEPGRPIAPADCRGDVQILDIKSGKWTNGRSKPIPETGVTSAENGPEIFVLSCYNHAGTVSALVEVYNANTNRWRRIPDMPTARTGVPCGIVDGRLLCVGGLGADLKPTAAFEIYDLEGNSWKSVKCSHPPIADSGYAVHRDQLLVIGGRH